MNGISGPRRAGAAAAALLALLAAGCEQADHDGTQANTTTSAADATSSGPGAPTEQNPPNPGRLFIANPAVVGASPISFDSWSRVAPDRIAVNFQIGSPDCYGVDATATETGSTVTVALRSGKLPEAMGRMCTMIAVFGTLDIPLKQPLGNRKVLSAT